MIVPFHIAKSKSFSRASDKELIGKFHRTTVNDDVILAYNENLIYINLSWKKCCAIMAQKLLKWMLLKPGTVAHILPQTQCTIYVLVTSEAMTGTCWQHLLVCNKIRARKIKIHELALK